MGPAEGKDVKRECISTPKPQPVKHASEGKVCPGRVGGKLAGGGGKEGLKKDEDASSARHLEKTLQEKKGVFRNRTDGGKCQLVATE